MGLFDGIIIGMGLLIREMGVGWIYIYLCMLGVFGFYTFGGLEFGVWRVYEIPGPFSFCEGWPTYLVNNYALFFVFFWIYLF
jgi:hypothetical protein